MDYHSIIIIIIVNTNWKYTLTTLDLSLAYQDLHDLYTLSFPHLRRILLPGLQIQSHPHSIKPVSIEQYRGSLYPRDCHLEEDYLPTDGVMDEYVFVNSSLGNDVFTLLVLPLVSRARVIDIRGNNNNIDDDDDWKLEI